VSPSQLSLHDKSVNGSFSAEHYSLASHRLLVQAALCVHDHTVHIDDEEMTRLGRLTYRQIMQCSTHPASAGYCAKVRMSEMGESSILAAILVNLLIPIC
jgi:hypothetical protein